MAFSVIIPTLNEAGGIAETIHLLRRHNPREIIVVDGGSSDGTLDRARGADILLSGPRGRATQMNIGAAHASGDSFLFLHADCCLENGALAAAQRCLNHADVIACCFRMSVQANGVLFRSIEACASARVRLTGLIYGDQGLAMRRCDFRQLGGFPALRFMEDLVFSQQLRRLGRLVVCNRRIFVSPRRWHQTGLLCQTLRNWTLTALATVGVHPDRLAHAYPAVR